MNDLGKKVSFLFDYPDDLIFFTDKDKHIIECNKLVIDNLGYSSEELRDINAEKLFQDNISEEFKSFFNIGFSNKTVNTSLISKNGTIIPSELKLSKNS